MKNELRDEIAELLQAVFTREEGGSLLTRFVVVAETVGPDGKRGLWRLAHQGASAWDTLGLIAYVDAEERASIVADHLREG